MRSSLELRVVTWLLELARYLFSAVLYFVQVT